MKLVFLGASRFAVPALEALARSDHELAAVVVPPAAPAGRGMRLRPTPVEDAARAAGITVLAPADCNDPGFVSELASLEPELGALVAFGSILRRDLLAVPARGFVNLHPSLLPRWRGAAPIPRTLMAGDTETGNTIIRINERVDAGDILAREKVTVGPDETAGELSGRLASAGARLLLATINRLAREDIPGRPQDQDLATPAPKLRPEDRILDWTRPSAELHNRIRALSPEPGALTRFRGRRLLVLRARERTETAPVFPAGHGRKPDNQPVKRESPRISPGCIVLEQSGLVTQTGKGFLELLELKPEGGRSQTGQAFRNGARLSPGERLT